MTHEDIAKHTSQYIANGGVIHRFRVRTVADIKATYDVTKPFNPYLEKNNEED